MSSRSGEASLRTTEQRRAQVRESQRRRRDRLAAAGIVPANIELPRWAVGAITRASRELAKIAEGEQLGVIVGYRNKQGRSVLFRL